ncbi:tetratricopeptide repeat protein [Streptomyces sp. NPDC056503]|uniref:tetratricopeptide repeat protein n=1 Tax=Streptomyces sp. NPDC056503 TaxID=3345842 RepID=UPI0036CF1C8A
MNEEQELVGEAALAELRKELSDAMARRRLSKAQAAGLAQLGRTTVWAAFRDGGPVPSDQTVAALAKVLHLGVERMLGLRRSAMVEGSVSTTGTAGTAAPGPGRPIGEWDPHVLEVHPAVPASICEGSPGPSGDPVLAGYVRREHDRLLATLVDQAAAGRSRMTVLVGSSSTGKTRACWEAVQPLAVEGWRLWHPFDPTRAEAALADLVSVAPRTVIWLNEAQHYLGDREHGERIASALHRLLITPERGPVLVFGTLWPEYARQFTALPAAGAPDPHSRVRELLTGRILTIPEAFDAAALAGAAALAKSGDALLADALTRSDRDGRVAQDLAGGPALLERFRHASPAGRALLEAAMDARRLGVGLHLPAAFLAGAVADYLSDPERDHLPDDWAEQAFGELADGVHGKHSALRRTTPRAGQRPSTPAASYVTPPYFPGPLLRLADYLEQHGKATREHVCPPASFWHAAHDHLTHADDLSSLAKAADRRHRLQWAHFLHRRAAHLKRLYTPSPARQERKAGVVAGSETVWAGADDFDYGPTLFGLAMECEQAGDTAGAEAFYQQAADVGDSAALSHLARIREEAGDHDAAEALALQAADRGNRYVLSRMAMVREMTGDQEGAKVFYRHAARRGDSVALSYLAQRLEEVGDVEGVESFYQEAAFHNDSFALAHLARIREEAGDHDAAEALALRAVRLDDSFALYGLAQRRLAAGNLHGAETLYRQAADLGDTQTLVRLATMRAEAGDLRSANALYREAADRGGSKVNRPVFDKLWPHGLDPDGTPTPRWNSS